MKIFVVNGENGGEKTAIEIEGLTFVSEIKLRLPEECRVNYFWLINSNNFLLNDNDHLSRYNLSDNDEIWHGSLENFIKKDDVIVEIFLSGWTPFISWLVVKVNQSMSEIRAALVRIEPDIINIFNGDGQLMEDNQLVTDIDRDGYYRLIISCGRGANMNLAFDECYKFYKLHILRFKYSK